jgi:hypothetical protein
MKKINKIEFIAVGEYTNQVGLKPTPASDFIPDWYKKMSVLPEGYKKIDLDPKISVTGKRCFPILDSLQAGYIIPMWSDVLVSYKEGMEYPVLKWQTTESPIDTWNLPQSNGIEVPNGYEDMAFKFIHNWIIKTPPGYSCLFIHPVGYNNLPFKTVGGIVDTDKLETLINPPFWMKKGWEGIIEKGTPMVQVIPFKRDDWESSYSTITPERHMMDHDRTIGSKIISAYGKYLREKKSYF